MFNGSEKDDDGVANTNIREKSDASDLYSSVNNGSLIASNRNWTSLENMGRFMFLCSVAFFIAGVTITVFGYTGVEENQRTSLKILGPACLTMTFVMWILGCVLSRMWNLEWKRRQKAYDLRDRVRLHAYAVDFLNNPSLSVENLDPVIKRKLLDKLRSQAIYDNDDSQSIDLERTLNSSAENQNIHSNKVKQIRSGSLVTPTTINQSCKRRYSIATLSTQFENNRKSSLHSPLTIYECPKGKEFELPGIQISRFETFDMDDRRSSVASGSHHYIVIRSDLGSDLSRLNCPSDYSLGGSRRSSRSRSSRASSNVSFISSRIWDFSPRESEWDTDISLGSSYCSQISIHRTDWGGAICEHISSDNSFSSRKLSVLTVDRRHSSPEPTRRHSTPMYNMTGIGPTTSSTTTANHPDSIESDPNVETRLMFTDSSSKYKTTSEEDIEYNWNEQVDTDCSSDKKLNYRLKKKRRSTLRRNNTDDSEVERRVTNLLKDIEMSATESVDESKIFSLSDCESAILQRPKIGNEESSEINKRNALSPSMSYQRINQQLSASSNRQQQQHQEEEQQHHFRKNSISSIFKRSNFPGIFSGFTKKTERKQQSYDYHSVPVTEQQGINLGRTPPPAYEDIIKDV